MERILVPIDGSKEALASLKKALEIGEGFKSEVTILYVATDVTNKIPDFDMEELNLDIDGLLALACRQGNKVLSESKEIIKNYSFGVRSLIKVGDPAEEIINLTKDENFDLVVMGNRGLNSFSRVMMGSVSNRVMNHVESSVYIVKDK